MRDLASYLRRNAIAAAIAAAVTAAAILAGTQFDPRAEASVEAAAPLTRVEAMPVIQASLTNPCRSWATSALPAGAVAAAV